MYDQRGNRQALSTADLAIALAVVAFGLAVVTPLVQGRIDHAQGVRTLAEAQAIAEAALVYRQRLGVWPQSLDQLAAQDLTAMAVTNVFGWPWTIQGQDPSVRVSTALPAEALALTDRTDVSVTDQGDGLRRLTVSRSLPDNGTADIRFMQRQLSGLP